MKRCRICNELKPFDAFYRMKEMRDGYRYDCKACNLAAPKGRGRADPEPTIEREGVAKRKPERAAETQRRIPLERDTRR